MPLIWSCNPHHSWITTTLGGPRQERGDIGCVLLNGLRRAVVERHLAIGQRLRHLDRVSRKVGVVIGSLREREASGRLVKSLQHGGNVIRTLLLELDEGVEDKLRERPIVAARLRQQRQVGRRRAAVRGPRGLFVRKRRRNFAGEPTGT